MSSLEVRGNTVLGLCHFPCASTVCDHACSLSCWCAQSDWYCLQTRRFQPQWFVPKNKCLRYLKGWMKIWQLLHRILEGQNVLEVRCSRSFLGKEIGCKRADVPDFWASSGNPIRVFYGEKYPPCDITSPSLQVTAPDNIKQRKVQTNIKQQMVKSNTSRRDVSRKGRMIWFVSHRICPDAVAVGDDR